jgi:hypothetical protein
VAPSPIEGRLYPGQGILHARKRVVELTSREKPAKAPVKLATPEELLASAFDLDRRLTLGSAAYGDFAIFISAPQAIQ